MSDIKLFRTTSNPAVELQGKSVILEKSLQTLIEKNLDCFLGIRFLATEHSTGKKHGGRIDTLGIDENNCPCIIEYKRRSDENVINQGLFYLDWLMDHKAEFELLVIKEYSKEVADEIEWSIPRLLCIAGSFNKYDEHAVQQMNHNIELIRYRMFDDQFLLLEMVHAVSSTPSTKKHESTTTTLPTLETNHSKQARSIEDFMDRASPQLMEVYNNLKEYLLELGDDVQMKMLKWYIAFKRIKNFASIEFQYAKDRLLVGVKINPDSVELEEGFTRDVRKIGHLGTGDLRIIIQNNNDLQKAIPLLEASYEND